MGARVLQAVIDRPRRVLAAAVLLTVAAVFAAGQLEPSAPPSLLAERGSAVATATRSVERSFGAEPIVVVARGDLTDTLAAANLTALLDLERRVARLHGVQEVFGPGTFVSQTVRRRSAPTAPLGSRPRARAARVRRCCRHSGPVNAPACARSGRCASSTKSCSCGSGTSDRRRS
jgi:predicted RND superfamily exporter protein